MTMNIELLVDAREFWERMKEDLARARHSAYVQTFSFEGDRVGTGLARALQRCRARDRRLLVDGYSRLYHSDRLIVGPAWLERPFRREVMLTRRWVRRLRDGGARVRFGKPLGPSPVRLLRRSHKKLACFDESVAYVGGINFSDHNFAWHDMMFRIECPSVAAHFAEEFRSTFAGRASCYDVEIGPLRLISMSGRGNPARFAPVIEAIRGARRRIRVASPYLTYPFTIYLTQAILRGVQVQVLMPDRNNKSNLARHILERATQSGFEILRYHGGMSHLKAMLIDDDLLVAGSSNFDFMSYHILEEHVVMTRAPSLVDAYRSRVWDPDAAAAVVEPVRSSIGTRLGDAAVRLGASIAGTLALTGEEGA
jgi:cardiolipin synthase